MNAKILVLAVLALFPFAASSAIEPVFETRYDYLAGDSVSCVYAADFNRDGLQDLATANLADDSITVLLNTSDGVRMEIANYYSGNGPYYLSGGDFDGDGSTDLAVANIYADSISILFNDGQGAFQAPVSYPAGDGPSALAVADFDGDGDLDIGVIHLYSDTSLTIFLNNSQGIFQQDGNYATGSRCYAICSADFDGDGDKDLAVASYDNSRVDIFFNYGDGTFENRVSYATWQSMTIDAGDFDADGDIDLVIARYVSNGIYLLANQGNGTFRSQQTIEGMESPVSVKFADINIDGFLDIVASGRNADSVAIFQNNRNGQFSDHQSYGTGDYPRWVTAGDFTGDGVPDLAIANREDGTVSIIKNRGNGALGEPLKLAPLNNADWVVPIDIDNDDDTDLVAFYAYFALVIRNEGNHNFINLRNFTIPSNPIYPQAIDFDHDGYYDLLVPVESSTVALYRNMRNGFFDPAGSVPLYASPSSACVADFNGDGFDDFAVTMNVAGNVMVFAGDSLGEFGLVDSVYIGGHAWLIKSSDLNGDGVPDLAVINSTNNYLTVLLNEGDLHFTRRAVYIGSAPYSMAISDFDGDGDADIAINTINPHGIVILSNDGQGNFSIIGNISNVDNTYPLVAADFDLDGVADLVASEFYSVLFFKNTGNGTFQNPQTYFTDSPILSIAQADLDNNGSSDLIISNKVSILYDCYSAVGVSNSSIQRPEPMSLLQNYPNPFNTQTTIRYILSKAGPITLSVYDILGRKMSTLIDCPQSPGEHLVSWDAFGLSSGIYFARLETASGSQHLKLLLLK